MLIERDLTITAVVRDSLDVHPRPDHCDQVMDGGHGFFLSVNAAGYRYQICGRCGTVRISEWHE
jgi:hypothetical protein